MEKSIFREKNVESISSPDSLNDYIRVVSPSVWATLVAVILLLIGVTIWGIVGRLDSVVPAVVVADEGSAIVYVEDSDAMGMLKESVVTVGGQEYSIDADEYTVEKLHVQNDGDILDMFGSAVNAENVVVRVFNIDADLRSGMYKGTIVVDSVKPISFVTN